MGLVDSLILAVFSAAMGFGFSHFQSDDRYVALNKGKYQLESTGALLSAIAMIVLTGVSAGATLTAIFIAIFIEHEMIKQYIVLTLLFVALCFATWLLAVRSAKSYNPYMIFVKTDVSYYRIFEVSDAGYLFNPVNFVKDRVSISDTAICKPITVLAENEYRLLSIKKKDFTSMTAASFSSAFEK